MRAGKMTSKGQASVFSLGLLAVLGFGLGDIACSPTDVLSPPPGNVGIGGTEANGGNSSGTGGSAAAAVSSIHTGGIAASTGGVTSTASGGATPLSTGGAMAVTGGRANTGGAMAVTGGQANTGGAMAVTGGQQASTGGTTASTGGQASTSGTTASTGGQASTGGTTSSASGGTTAAATGGATGTAGSTSGSVLMPDGACGTTTAGTAIAKTVVCAAADTQLCDKTCGPINVGYKTETCTSAAYVEGSCQFPTGVDYSCFKVPTADSASCPTTEPQHGQPCSITQCSTPCTGTACEICGVAAGYLDTSGNQKTGYCVCAAGSSGGKWSCSSTTAWPCPAGQGC